MQSTISNQSRKKYAWRSFLNTIAILFALLGGILLLRGYFLSNPYIPSSPGSNVDDKLPENPPLQYTVNVDSLKEIDNSTPVWGNRLVSSFDSIAGDVVIAKQSDTQSLLKLNSLDKQPELLYEIPLSANSIRLFADSSLLFGMTSTNVSAASVNGYTANSEKTLYTLPLGQDIDSIFFDANEKLILFSSHTSTQAYITALRANGQPIDIFTINGTMPLEIINSDSQLNVLWYKLENQCYRLDVINKSYKLVECSLIKQSSSNLNFSSNPQAGTERDYIKRTDLPSGNQQIVVSAGSDNVRYGFLTQKKGILAFLQTELVPDESGEVEYKVKVFEVSSNKVVRELKYLPDGEITDLGVDSSGAVLLITEIDAVSTLWKENVKAKNPATYSDQWESFSIEMCSSDCKLELLD